MLCRAAINIVRRSISNDARMLYRAQSDLQSSFTMCSDNIRQNSIQNNYNLYVIKRFKTRRKKPIEIKDDDDDDDEESTENENETDAPVGSKVVTVNCASSRLDNICKAGFGMSRSKVEEAYYASKIRVNGEKVLKKSKELKEDDEIDLILHQHMENPELLYVNRILILSMSPATNGIRVKLSRDKNLLIENYKNAWSP